MLEVKFYVDSNVLIITMRHLLILIGILLPSILMAQSMKPKGSFQTHVGLPVNLRNESFKGFMQGLVTVSTHYQYSLKSGLGFGIGASYHYFDINEFKAPEPAVGGMHSPNAWLKLGYEKVHTRNFGTDLGLRLGYSYTLFRSDLLQEQAMNPKVVPNLFIEPTGSIIMFGEDLTSFKFTVGYQIQGTGFEPSFLGMDTDGGYDPSRFSNKIQSLTFSFGYVHYFRMH